MCANCVSGYVEIFFIVYKTALFGLRRQSGDMPFSPCFAAHDYRLFSAVKSAITDSLSHRSKAILTELKAFFLAFTSGTLRSQALERTVT